MKENQEIGKGNYALASHNWCDNTTLFSSLHRSDIDMTAYLTDLDTIYEYTITEVVMVDPHRIDMIEDQDNSMFTLMTCNTDGTERLIVQGELTDSMPYEKMKHK